MGARAVHSCEDEVVGERPQHHRGRYAHRRSSLRGDVFRVGQAARASAIRGRGGALFETSEDDRKLYVAMADIEEDGLVLDVGTKVLFKVYKDHTGVGGCEVTSA